MARFAGLIALLLTVDVSAASLSVGIAASARVHSNRGFNPTTSFHPDDKASLAVTVANSGERDATGVVVTIDIGEGTRFVAADSTSFDCEALPSRVTCRATSLKSRTAAAITIRVITPSIYTGTFLTFSAQVAANESDLVPSFVTKQAVAINPFFVVRNTDDEGPGSLRQAILDANAQCKVLFPVGGQPARYCTIGFRIAGPLPDSDFFTIRPSTALPIADFNGDIHGGTQSAWLDLAGDMPRIMLDGSQLTGAVDGLVSIRDTDVIDLAIGNFPRFGIYVDNAATNTIDRVYAGVDPTGRVAAPNERGIGIARSFSTLITNSVISGNRRSGIVVSNATAFIDDNRIGVEANSNAPLPNGASGIFLPGTAGANLNVLPYGAEAYIRGNVIANHPDFGVAIGVPLQRMIDITGNSIHDNGANGIDYGLDGASPNVADDSTRFPNTPTIISTRATRSETKIDFTVVTSARVTLMPEYPFPPGPFPFYPSRFASARADVDLYANDAPRTQTQRFLGTVFLGDLALDRATLLSGTLTVNEDLRGKWITAVTRRSREDCYTDICRNSHEASEASAPFAVR